MPKISLDEIPQTNATGYPAPFDLQVKGRNYRRLAPVSGLSHMGASHVVLKPGAWSSHRHWHKGEDEFVVMLSGEAILVEDGGETILSSGDLAAFPAGQPNGHHLQNRSGADCVYLAFSAGNRSKGGCYSDIDMLFTDDGYYRKDGTKYDTERLP